MRPVAVNRLYIVEKPSVATALVEALDLAFGAKVVNKPSVDWYYRMSNGDCVCPLVGHVIEIEFLKPEHKRAALGTYFEFLPVKVFEPTYKPKPDIDRSTGKPRYNRAGEPIPTKAYDSAMMLLKSAKEVVNAGDTDREGQRIFDELAAYSGVDPYGANKPIWRLPVTTSRPADLAVLLGKPLEKNSDVKWVWRSQEALVRQLLDAAVGLNGSMAIQELTGIPNASAGRVQTTVLQIVDDRDRAIDAFRPTNYYVPVITMGDGAEMRWFERDGAQGQPGFDMEGRIIDRKLAQGIVDRIARGLAGTVTAADSQRVREAPPLPYTNASLASAVSKRFGCTVKEAEKAAQNLYEKHKAISYVGTECAFLPESMLEDARGTLQALAQIMPGKANGADLSLRSAAWNDDKVEAGGHHGIIPTGDLPRSASVLERQVFDTVAKRYISQFYPDFVSVRHSLAALFGPDEFRASRNEVVHNGWKSVESEADASAKSGEHSGPADLDSDDQDDAAVEVGGRSSDRGVRR